MIIDEIVYSGCKKNGRRLITGSYSRKCTVDVFDLREKIKSASHT